MKRFSFLKLSESDGSWSALMRDWEQQCATVGEAIDAYASASIPVLEGLARSPEVNAGVFCLVSEDGAHHAVVQLNRAMLPGTSGWTLRGRHLILSPNYDFGSFSDDDYGIAVGNTVWHTLNVARYALPSDHVKFHLRSPQDRLFFSILSSELSGIDAFSEVRVVGAWLHISFSTR